MGTYIHLRINKTLIDWGKNYSYKNHFWLFPYESKKIVEYEYANNVIENKEGFSSSLREIKFRMDNLGYSLNETKVKYAKQLKKWNRTSNLNLPFNILEAIVLNIDLNIITESYLRGNTINENGIRTYIKKKICLNPWFIKNNAEDECYGLEDFIDEILDVNILLRIFCEKKENLDFNLVWEYIDLVESGWASIEDIQDFDELNFMFQHNKLYGNLQDLAIESNRKNAYESNFNEWLFSKNIPNNKIYSKIDKKGKLIKVNRVLPVFIRNIIHHPENSNNEYTSEELWQSINYMLLILRPK